jgi:formylglycine-generating enzyme
MKLVPFPAGEIMMDSPHAEPSAGSCERPQQRVWITQPFYMGVSQSRRFVDDVGYQTEAEKDGKGGLGWNGETKKFELNPRYHWRDPGFDQTDEHPVVNVTWNDAVAFAKWLSRKEGKTYRLPTEAEWEYACRAGTTSRFSNGDILRNVVAVGNVKDRTATEKQPTWGATIPTRDGYIYTAPVGQFHYNAFGLNDMHGNAEEWCSDRFDADYYQQSPVDDPPGASGVKDRVTRGGGWFNIPANTRSAGRWHWPPDHKVNWLGFRVAMVSSGP